jgi:hypothetical protein
VQQLQRAMEARQDNQLEPREAKGMIGTKLQKSGSENAKKGI